MGSDAPAFQNQSIGDTSGSVKLPGAFGGATINTGSKGIPGGKELEAYAQQLLSGGLPANLKADLLKQGQGQIAGNLRSGTQNLDEMLSGSGASIGAGIEGQSKLNQNAAKAGNDLNLGIAEQDFNARNQGFADELGLSQTAIGLGNAKNQYGLQKSQADNANSFGNVLSGLIGDTIGAGGQLGGEAIRAGKGG